MKYAQIAKQVEYRKQTQQNHYGPPQQQDIKYGRNDKNKRSNTTYGRDDYQDKRSRNDRGRPTSRYRSNSHTRFRTAQAITTEMVQHSIITKRNIKISQQHLTSRSTTEIHQTHAV
jgi:hypothetical protein